MVPVRGYQETVIGIVAGIVAGYQETVIGIVAGLWSSRAGTNENMANIAFLAV
jgi:hypothetical protein